MPGRRRWPILFVAVLFLGLSCTSWAQLRAQAPNSAERPQTSLAFTPLSDMRADEKYKGFAGGLYGNGQNEPPAAHVQAVAGEVLNIVPRNKDGQPDPAGKVALISIGMSNTTQEFSEFMRAVRNRRDVSPNLVIVDGAQGGQEASAWAGSGRRGRDPWAELTRRLDAAGVSPAQVQVAWLKQARAMPAALGEFPKHAEALRDDVITCLNTLRTTYPNLRLVYLSSRIYAGNARSALNPEPYAYEGAFAMRWVIEKQIAGEATLNFQAKLGPVKAPAVLWGPYLWANGAQARADGLTWQPGDFGPDGTHPSAAGQKKVAAELEKFFAGQPTAKPWFLGAAK